MFILDVLRYDIEKVDNILNLLNDEGCVGWRVFWNRDFNRDEVVAALEQLARFKLVNVLREHSAALVPTDFPENFLQVADSLWFQLNGHGRHAWERWTPPIRFDENLD